MEPDSRSLASKRSRDWTGAGSDEEEVEEVDHEDEEGNFALELTASHPWGVKPWGNFHWEQQQQQQQQQQDKNINSTTSACVVDARSCAGLLGVLDDETLLCVLGLLEPASLARAGQTCRALAAFAAHEPLWRDLLLAARGGDWRWAGSFRNTLVAALGGKAECRPLQVQGLYSDLLNKSWLCATARFNRSWLGADTVPRERADELSVEDFLRKYERPNRPVLISGLVRKWPLSTNLDAWLESRQDTLFKVGESRMTLRNFLHYANEALDEDPLYLFDKHFAHTCPELEKMYEIPPYFSQDRDLFGLLGEEQRPDYRWLIIGGPCSGSTFHIDPNGTSAWNAVLRGSKKWIMAPKSVSIPGVFPSAGFGEVATTLSAVEWFVDFYHQLKEQDVPVLECIQRPGDIIFVPHGWFHIVLNLENSVAVTHNYVSESNLVHVMQFLDKTPDQVSGVSSSRKHSLGPLFRDALRQHRPQILSKLEEAEAKARMPSPWDAAKSGDTFSLFK